MSDPLDPRAYLDSIAAQLEAEGHAKPHPASTEEANLMLLSLSRRARTVFMLHRLGEYSYEEIADARGITREHVEQLMAEALFGLVRAKRMIDRHRSPVTGALPLFVRLRLRLGLVP